MPGKKLLSSHGFRAAFQALQVTDRSPQVFFWGPALSFTASTQAKEQGVPSHQLPLLVDARLDIRIDFVIHLWATVMLTIKLGLAMD